METKLKEIWSVVWYRNVSFWEITVMYKIKYLNEEIVAFCKTFKKIIFNAKWFKKFSFV